MKKLQQAFVSVAGAALASLVLISGALAQDRVVKFAIPFPEVEYMPLYAAQQNGYFRDEHLSVEVFAMSSGDKITLALASGSVDIANYTPDWFVRAIEKGAPIKIVAGSSNVPVYSLVTTASINSYADLKGKRVAVSAVKASDAYLVRKMFSAHGLQSGDYDLIQAGSSGDRAAALKAGSVSATLLIPPYDSVIVAEGYKRLDVSTGTVTQYTWLSHATSEAWAKANKATLVAFIRAWIKGTRWVYDPKNKQDAVRILARELKIDERFAQIAYEMYFASKTETVSKDAAIDLVGLQNLIDAVAAQGDIPSPAPKAAKYVDSIYLQEALNSLK
jgi:ABC-type nitrate/sulfonate/bicarbonate transport system substrate-binding protein